MRITGVETVLYEHRLTRPIGDVHLPDGVSGGAGLAVFVRTDEGPTGEAIGVAGTAGPIASLAPLLEGRDPHAVRAIHDDLLSVAFKAGNAGPMKFAISALDCALWDLRAKAHGVPLWKELGADDPRVPAYASGLDTPLGDEELVDFYKGMARRGVRAGKLKVGRDADADERRLALMADALATGGDRPLLMVDANEFWTPKQAIQRVGRLEERFELAWVEEPVPRSDHVGLRRVSDGIRAPVATGENLNDARDYVPLLREGAVDVVQIGVLTSGITGALRIAELAWAFDRPVTMSNCPGRHMAHLAAALPHHTMMEVLDCGRDAVLARQPPLEDGHIALDDRPGSGISFDPELLEQHRVDALSGPTLGDVYRRAPDAGSIG